MRIIRNTGLESVQPNRKASVLLGTVTGRGVLLQESLSLPTKYAK